MEPLEKKKGEAVLEELESSCSTPYVSAPSSPGRGTLPGFFYSAPASPMHFAITSFEDTHSSAPTGYEFEFSARFGSAGSAGSGSGSGSGSMTSADELFLNGQIRPLKLSTHLERPQVLAPLLDLEGEEGARGRDLRLRDKSVRRRTRSMSPLRSNIPLEWTDNEEEEEEDPIEHHNVIVVTSDNQINVSSSETTPSSSRSSSAGRSSKRWVFLKDFLRSKSEGSSSNTHNNKFWSTISFSPTKDKKSKKGPSSQTPHKSKGATSQAWASRITGKPTNGVGKRRVPPSPSPHELHYKANRAQAQELRKKTFLPYRQGLLGCLGFTSKGYGAINGIARALNPVSST